MAQYKVKKAGYYIGTYYAEGTMLELNDKQAKYGVMSGQIEKVMPKSMTVKHDIPKKAAKSPERYGKSRKSVRSTWGGSVA